MSINITTTTKRGHKVTIRNLNSIEQVQQIHNTWSQKEGWSPCATDPECFFEIDPHGFFVAEVDNAEEEGVGEKRVVAIVCGLAYDEDYGFIGLYIADPNERGKGYGLAAFEAAMEYLGKERTVGLEGVVAQQHNYQKSGFKTLCDNMRYAIDVASVKQRATKSDSMTEGTNFKVVTIDQVAIEELNAYDRQIFQHDRQAFLSKWISRPGTVALAAVVDKTVVGYGVVRPCDGGVYRVGPLFADSQQIAENLFVGMAEAVPHENWQIYMDGALSSENLNNLVTKYDMKPIFPFARMYRLGTNKGMPQDDIDRIYGISSAEVG